MPDFCNLIFGHRDLSLYENVWALIQFHNWTYDALMDLLPWEYDVMTSLTSGYIETQEMQAKQNRNAR